VKDVFGILLQHMRDTASSRNIKTVDLVPLVFSKVVPKKNLFSISSMALSSAVAKAEAKHTARATLGVCTPRGKKRRLSDFVLSA
jgi:hypothetical protein